MANIITLEEDQALSRRVIVPAPMHLGKRLYQQRRRLDITPEAAAAASPTDDIPTDPKSFGAWVRAQRLQRGWDRGDLAAAVGISYSGVANIETGASNAGLTTREKIIAVLTDPGVNVPMSSSPQEDQTMLDHNQSSGLRTRLIETILARHINQRQAAQSMGLKPTAIRDILKNPDGLIPQDLAAAITTWLNQPAPQETPMPSTPDDALADSLAQIATATANDVSSLAAADVASATAAADAIDTSTDDTPSPIPDHAPRSTPHAPPAPLRMFNHITVRLDELLDPGALALVTLVDKLPAYKDAGDNQTYWFQTFNNLIDFARLVMPPAGERPAK